jgi:hypothetical protein
LTQRTKRGAIGAMKLIKWIKQFDIYATLPWKKGKYEQTKFFFSAYFVPQKILRIKPQVKFFIWEKKVSPALSYRRIKLGSFRVAMGKEIVEKV